jgi:hypothetical protein
LRIIGHLLDATSILTFSNVPHLPVDAHSQILIGFSSISHRQYPSGLHRSTPGAITHE